MERHGEAWFGSFTNYPVGRGGAYFHFPGSILVSWRMRPLVDASFNGRIVLGTHRRRDASFKGASFKDTSSKGQNIPDFPFVDTAVGDEI